jgi:hypothetical protein
MTVSDFYSRFTLRTLEGRVVLFGSAANLILAAGIALVSDQIPDALSVGMVALASPVLLFVWHAKSFIHGKLEGRWFRVTTLIVLALAPLAVLLKNVLHV